MSCREIYYFTTRPLLNFEKVLDVLFVKQKNCGHKNCGHNNNRDRVITIDNNRDVAIVTTEILQRVVLTIKCYSKVKLAPKITLQRKLKYLPSFSSSFSSFLKLM